MIMEHHPDNIISSQKHSFCEICNINIQVTQVRLHLLLHRNVYTSSHEYRYVHSTLTFLKVKYQHVCL